MDIRKDESGIIVIALMFLGALIIFGFVVFNSITKSREADQVKESANQVIEEAQEVVEDEITRNIELLTE